VPSSPHNSTVLKTNAHFGPNLGLGSASPFNPKIMEKKTQLTNIYITRNSNGDLKGEDHYSSYDQMAIIIYKGKKNCSYKNIQNYKSSWTTNHKIKPCGT
jgi:hypothetical protein